MIEEALVQYGILGLWTASMLVERYSFNRKIKEVIDNNTAVLSIVVDRMHINKN